MKITAIIPVYNAGPFLGRSVTSVLATRDPPALVADAGKAERLLGWAPRRSDIGTIVGDAWRWQVSLEARVSRAASA